MPTTEDQLIELIQSANGLTNEVRGKMDGIDNKITEIEGKTQSELNYFRQEADKANAWVSVAPNMIADSKEFLRINNGELGRKVLGVESGIVKFPWSVGTNHGKFGEIGFERIPIQYIDRPSSRLHALGLGDVSLFEQKRAIGQIRKPEENDVPNEDPETWRRYGSYYYVMVIDVTLEEWSPKPDYPNSAAYCLLSQDCVANYGWHRGQTKNYGSCFFALLDGPDDSFSQLQVMGNRLGGKTYYFKDFKGKGWQHHTNTRTGFGGCAQYFRLYSKTPGYYRYAIALPYAGTGDHQGNFVWAGSVTSNTSYTHGDIYGFTSMDQVDALKNLIGNEG